MDKQPFILGVGAPRCGTTWAYSNWRAASDLYLPPIKELRYFHGTRSLEQRENTARKILEDPNVDARDRMFTRRWLAAKDGDKASYGTLFPIHGPVGEISPIYSIMPPPRIAALKTALTGFDPQVFYFMRNPFLRDISHILFALHRQARQNAPRPVEDYEAFIAQPAFRQRSAYRRNLGNWRRAFGDQLHVYYYDDLNRAPDQFFEQLCVDLGLAHDPARVRKARENAAQTKKMAPATLPRDILSPRRGRYLWRIANWKFLPDRIAQNWMGEIEAYDIG